MARPTEQRVEGPFTHNVYLGFSAADLPMMNKLQERLEAEYNIRCYPRFTAVDIKAATKQTIDEGFMCCQKCLIYVSEDYVKDEWFTMESEKVREKSSRFSRDTVFVLCDSKVKDNIPDVFKGFSPAVVTKIDLDNPAWLGKLAQDLSREPNPQLAMMPKENIGYGSALGYYYGYLRLVLPDFRKRLEEQTLGENVELRNRTVKKMLIIMPESCFCPPQFTEDGKIEHTEKYVVRMAHRAGNKNRDYKSSLYKIIDQQTHEEYYFVAELATPLLTLYESYYFGVANMNRDQLFIERNAFYISLKAVLSHPSNRECNNQFKLLFWPSDPEMKKAEVLSLYDFLLPVVRQEVEQQQEDLRHPVPTKGPDLEADSAVGDSSHNVGPKITTFMPVNVTGSNPAAIYEDSLFGYYKMDSSPRGICLIINIANFNKSAFEMSPQLKPRRGSQNDVCQLKELFGDRLNFDVQVHDDLEMDSLEKLLLTTSNRDHSQYDAFVCCFLTHGKLGVLYTADGQPIKIMDITDYFNDRNCPTLCGKPKLFFIQACMRGIENKDSPENSMNGSMMASDDAAPESVLHNREFEGGGHPVDVDLTTIEGDAGDLDWDAYVAPTLLAADQQPRTWLENKSTLVPGWPDFIMSYSTLPGSAAYRDTETGSLYIRELANCLVQRCEIDRALKLVTIGVSQRLNEFNQAESRSRFQLPFHLMTGVGKLLRLNQ